MPKMEGSKTIQREYHYWWRRKRLQERGWVEDKSDECAVSLPLPVFPPALDFDPYRFTLPPSYEEAVDLEKALYPPKSRLSASDETSARSSIWPVYHQSLTANEDHPLPPIGLFVRLLRYLRYILFTVYRRCFTFVVLCNLIGLLMLLHEFRSPERGKLSLFATLASSNFLLAILIRQDYVVNLLFRSAWLVPWSLPLRVRRIVSRVYCYGGIHSGAAVAGTMWWIFFTIGMCWTLIADGQYTLPIIILACIVSVLLAVIVLLALPGMRQRYHDTFEITHRFLGWTSVALFWAQTILLAHHSSMRAVPLGTRLIHDPTFWNLIVISLLLVYPWLRLRRWTFTAQALSSHAVRLSFTRPVHKFSCLTISSSPLLEWHPFATFPSTDPSIPGGSMVISSAGNWTRDLIHHVQARTCHLNRLNKEYQRVDSVKLRFYTKPHPKAGVLSLSLLYSRVLILTTGSGIGPSLSSLLDRPTHQHARLIWSTRSPAKTYGAEILSLVSRADERAVVLDTDEMGRPDLLELAWRMYRSEALEAVFVLSNERVVKWVVGGLERRGVPAFGPIWDS